MNINQLRRNAAFKLGLGIREKRILNAPDATIAPARDYPGCMKVATKSFNGDNTFVFRVSDYTVVN